MAERLQRRRGHPSFAASAPSLGITLRTACDPPLVPLRSLTRCLTGFSRCGDSQPERTDRSAGGLEAASQSVHDSAAPWCTS